MSNPIRTAVNNVPGNWQKQSYGTGPHCGLGHVLYALTGEHVSSTAFSAMSVSPYGWSIWDEVIITLSQAANDKFPERTVTVSSHPWFPNFNDHLDTTEQDVIAVMELAADRWDVEHE